MANLVDRYKQILSAGKGLINRIDESTTLDEKVGSFARGLTNATMQGYRQPVNNFRNNVSATRNFAKTYSYVPKSIGSDISQGFRDIPANIRLMNQNPMEFQKGVSSAVDYSRAGRLLSKGAEGIFEGMTYGGKDIPVAPSTNLAERGAYTAGFLGGSVVSPITKAAGMLGKAPLVKPLQKKLGTQAGRLIAQGGVKKLAGRGVANLSQGVPYSLAYQMSRPVFGEKPSARGLAGDTALDFGLASVPLVGGLLIGANSKSLKNADNITSARAFSNIKDRGLRAFISDKEAFIRQTAKPLTGGGNVYALGDLLSHNKLFKEYPELRQVFVKFDPNLPSNTLGGYFENSNTIVLNPKGGKNVSTLLHEVQHAIQGVEDMARGSGNKQARADALSRNIRLGKGSVNETDINKAYNSSLGEIEANLTKDSIRLGNKDLRNNQANIYDNYLKGNNIGTSDVLVNKGGRFSSKNTDPLIEEAKKYKSAEDVLDSHRVYHGGDAKFVDNLLKNKTFKPGAIRDAGTGGNRYGLSTSTSPEWARDFSTSSSGNGRVAELFIDPDAKVLDLKSKALDDLTEAETRKLAKNYDVIRDVDNFGGENEVRILNPDVLRDEQFMFSYWNLIDTGLKPNQKKLPDIWNQAQEPVLRVKPTGGKQLSNQAENLIKQEVDRLKSQVGGVDIIKTGEDATGGGYRASSNPQWYKDFFAEYGRKPSEAQYRELAIKNLKTGEVDGMFDNPEVLNYNRNILNKPLDDIDRQINAKPITESDAKKLAKQDLAGLLNYADDMAKSGYTQDQISRTSYKQFKELAKSGKGGNLPPQVRNDVKNTELAVDKKVNLLDYMRTPDRVLKKIGLEKEANLLKKKYDDYLTELPKEIDRITDWYNQVGKSKDSSTKIFRFLDGQSGVKLDANEQRVANEIKGYLEWWADRLGLPEDKRVSSYITHIFEKDFIRKEFDPEFEKMLVDSRNPAKSVYNPFLEQRKGKSGYVEDVFRALDAYVKRATRKANMDVALKELNKGAKGLDAQSLSYVKTLVDRVNLRPQQIDSLMDNFIKQIPVVRYKAGQRPTANITRKVRQWTYRGTLGLNFGSAVRNLTQGVNTYAQLGERWTTTGYLKAFRDMTNGSDELTRVGVLRDNFIQDRQLSATKKTLEKLDRGLWVFFDTAEKINRGGAYFGAKSRALAQGKSEAQAIKEGVEMARKTQFTFGSVDTPVALQGDVAKTILQFQSYNVKQAEFLTEMVKNKELSGLIRWAGANLVLVYALSDLLGYDLTDAIPFSGVATGETKIGQTPAIKLVSDVGKMALGGTDKYGNPIGAEQIGKDLIPLVPAGVQINKTLQGINTVNRGYVQSRSGRAYPNIIEPTTGNYLKGSLFGKSALPEVRKQYEDKVVPLGEKDTQALQILNLQDRKNYVSSVLQRRGSDRKESVFRDVLKGDKKTKDTQVQLLTGRGGVKYGIVNDKVIYLDENGGTKSIDTNFEVEKPQLTGSKELDKKLISGYKGDITKKKNDVVKLYELGVIDKDQAEAMLNAYEQLYKATGSGGSSKKAKKVKPISFKLPSSATKVTPLSLPNTLPSKKVNRVITQDQLSIPKSVSRTKVRRIS